jgi:hypothetical protein
MSQRNCNILCWNVGGLNDVIRQDAVSLLVRDTASTIVCLQETKLQAVDPGIVRRMVGANLPAILWYYRLPKGRHPPSSKRGLLSAFRPSLIHKCNDYNLHHEGRWDQMANHGGVRPTR